MDLPCHAPAQDLMVLNEMRAYVAEGSLPADLRDRARACLNARPLMTSPGVSRHHPSPHPLTDLIGWGELEVFAYTGMLPTGFRRRVSRILASEVCVTCGGMRCMDCRMRSWHEACAADCPGCCAP